MLIPFIVTSTTKVGLTSGEVIILAVNGWSGLRDPHRITTNEPFRDVYICANAEPHTSQRWSVYFFMVTIIIEGVLLILALRKAWAFRQPVSGFTLMQELTRDSAVYFFIIFCVYSANLIIWAVNRDLGRLSFSTSNPDVEMTFHSSRTTSSGSLIPFRFGSRSDSPQRSGWAQARDSTDSFTNGRARRASTQSSYKGKEPAHDVYNGHASPTTTTFPFAPNVSIPSSRFKPSYDSPRPLTADGMPTKKARGSILVAASDVLGFKFGRRKPPIVRQPPPMPLILPGVIEISASRRDEEDEERDRLREVAAQSLGLQVMPTPETHSLDESVEEVDEGEDEVEKEHEDHSSADNVKTDAFVFTPLSPKGSTHSVVPPSPIPFNRFRSRSLITHSRANSISVSPTPPIPPFPATFTVIDQFQQSGTMLYKYYHPSSLRIFALSKNWRHRFMVLSSPTSLVPWNSGPPVSYLHLFKSSAGEEKEMERLEINEESVVFIAEEEVGGRKHVVKVGGVDVGAMKKDLNSEENGRTMWFLHIRDPAEAQKWITVIKTAILGQRTVRAGLGLPTLGGVEPRGDMDVMLSMRAQGLITPPTSSKPTLPQNGSPQNGTATLDRNYASSIASHHSQATVARAGSTGAVSTLKGLFTGATRPRSGSRATSINSQHDRDRDPLEDSFGSMGNHLLGRPTAADTSIRPHSVTTHASLPISGSVSPTEHRLERKIANERPALWTSTSTSTSSTVEAPVKTDRAVKSLSLGGGLSLQPPRKRWTSAGPARPAPDISASRSEENTLHTDIESTGERETELPSSPAASGFTFGTPEQEPNAPSIKSVSTLASSDNAATAEKSSNSTKRSSRRWSRQLGILPRRLSPPSGPPPSVPTNQESSLRLGRLSVEIPAVQSETASTHSVPSQKSFVSSLPSFSKRASAGSSVHSASSSVQSPAVSRPPSTQSHRLSMPPQRPPPTAALPPAPGQDKVTGNTPSVAPPSKPSFRDSVAHRTFRLSMIAPKPPPSGVLPPRPDETPSSKSHRRNSSTGVYSQKPSTLEAIPASPVPPVAPSPPFPPPMGPLPPTPTTPLSTTTSRPSRPVSRRMSLKKRLRILSAPSSTAAASAQLQLSSEMQPSDNVLNGVAPLRRPLTSLTPSSASPPPTPIAEKITMYQNDPSFLQIYTPVIPHLPPPRALPVPPESHPEIISLSPPPRRGSKQISVIGSDTDPLAVEEDKSPLDGERRLMSLSRPGSVVSLGILSV
ncbi:hypothetical protein DXG01_015189 [Tephrocybe rancida]|nr:hypothetical protein DXG01_015189 [Tephrocybe rancida]